MVLREFITKIGFSVDESGLKQFDAAIGRISEKADKSYQHLMRMADTVTNIGKKASLFVSAPMAALATTSVMAYAKVEQVNTSFEVLLGSAEKANKLVKDLFQFEAKTPFKLDDVLKFSNKLINAQVPAEKVISMLTMLGEATAGDTRAMEGILIQLTQAKMARIANAVDIKIMANWGLPIYQALAEVMKTDEPGVFKAISKRQVKYETLLKALEQISSKRTGLMERQSKTIIGRLSSLSSAIFRLRVSIGKLIDENLGLRKILQKLIVFVNKLTEWIEKLNPGMKKFVAVLGFIAFAAGPALIALGSMLKLFIGLKVAIIAANIAGISIIGTIGKVGFALVGLLGKIALIMAPILAVWLIVQDFLMYQKYGESASLIFPIIDKIGGKLYHFVQNWVKPPILDAINFFKDKWEGIRQWWDNLWSNPWKTLLDAAIPDWLLTLIESISVKGSPTVKEQFAPRSTTSMFIPVLSPAVQDVAGVSIGSISVTAPVAAGTPEQMRQTFSGWVGPATENAIKEAVKQVNRQKK